MKFDGVTITFGMVIAFLLGWLIAVRRKTGKWGL